MTDNPTINRRRLLELTGVGTTMAVAGCTGQLDGDDGGSREVAVSVQPDQEDLQSQQEELQQEAQSENLSQEEYRAELQAIQQEATENAVATAEETFGDLGLTIEDQIDSQGLLLVTGSDGDILDSLEEDLVGVVTSGSTFERVKEQLEAQQEQREQLTEGAETESTDSETETSDSENESSDSE